MYQEFGNVQGQRSNTEHPQATEARVAGASARGGQVTVLWYRGWCSSIHPCSGVKHGADTTTSERKTSEEQRMRFGEFELHQL
jgi:hypothetical protein